MIRFDIEQSNWKLELGYAQELENKKLRYSLMINGHVKFRSNDATCFLYISEDEISKIKGYAVITNQEDNIPEIKIHMTAAKADILAIIDQFRFHHTTCANTLHVDVLLDYNSSRVIGYKKNEEQLIVTDIISVVGSLKNAT
jgi:hypothetical protein